MYLSMVLAMYGWDANQFINLFPQSIKDISIQNWTRLNYSSKADHCRHFKSLLYIENYLFTDLSYIARKKKKKKTLGNFHCSGHSLMIEKGRYTDVEREFRFCSFCQRNVFLDRGWISFLWYAQPMGIPEISVFLHTGDKI